MTFLPHTRANVNIQTNTITEAVKDEAQLLTNSSKNVTFLFVSIHSITVLSFIIGMIFFFMFTFFFTFSSHNYHSSFLHLLSHHHHTVLFPPSVGVWGGAVEAAAREAEDALCPHAVRWLRDGRGGWAAFTLAQVVADVAKRDGCMTLMS